MSASTHWTGTTLGTVIRGLFPAACGVGGGKVPTVDPNGGYPVIACDDCYSGPPDFCASGLNTAQAVADWNERMEMEEPYEAPSLLTVGERLAKEDLERARRER